MSNVTTLRDKVKDVELEPATIANGAVELLNEVSASKITGEEERYSHIDLVDFGANVDGAEAAFDAVKPILAAEERRPRGRARRRFADVDRRAGRYKVAAPTLRALHEADPG